MSYTRNYAYLCTHKQNNTRMERKRIELRKLLEAVEKEILKKPNKKVLDRLSLFAGYQDWEGFQKALHGQSGGFSNYDAEDGKYKSPRTDSKVPQTEGDSSHTDD